MMAKPLKFLQYFWLFRVLQGRNYQQDQVATMLAAAWAARKEERSRPLENESGLRNAECEMRNDEDGIAGGMPTTVCPQMNFELSIR